MLTARPGKRGEGDTRGYTRFNGGRLAAKPGPGGPVRRGRIPVSVDSSRPKILRFAVSAGAAYLNDIRGFGDPGLYPVLAASECRRAVMHAVQAAGAATKVVTGPAAVRGGVCRFFARRLAALQACCMARTARMRT